MGIPFEMGFVCSQTDQVARLRSFDSLNVIWLHLVRLGILWCNYIKKYLIFIILLAKSRVGARLYDIYCALEEKYYDVFLIKMSHTPKLIISNLRY